MAHRWNTTVIPADVDHEYGQRRYETYVSRTTWSFRAKPPVHRQSDDTAPIRSQFAHLRRPDLSRPWLPLSLSSLGEMAGIYLDRMGINRLVRW